MATSTAQSKLVEVIKFSNNAQSNRENLKQLNVMISECGLTSVLDGSRRMEIFLGTLLAQLGPQDPKSF
jgi:hypothetical protein